MARVNLGPNLIEKGIYFLFGGRKLKKVDYEKKVKDIFLNNANVIVIDEGNLIGAYNPYIS